MRWLRQWLGRLLGERSDYLVSVCDEPPDHVRPSRLYLIGERDKYWLAVMLCPCGCGDQIQLPLSGRSSPCWTYNGPSKAPTLSPSVRRTTNCRSHFLLRRGRIVWCGE